MGTQTDFGLLWNTLYWLNAENKCILLSLTEEFFSLFCVKQQYYDGKYQLRHQEKSVVWILPFKFIPFFPPASCNLFLLEKHLSTTAQTTEYWWHIFQEMKMKISVNMHLVWKSEVNMSILYVCVVYISCTFNIFLFFLSILTLFGFYNWNVILLMPGVTALICAVKMLQTNLTGDWNYSNITI